MGINAARKMRKCRGVFVLVWFFGEFFLVVVLYLRERFRARCSAMGQVGAGAVKEPNALLRESVVGPMPDIPGKGAWEM